MHTTQLRISLVIPAYNEERYLSGCLDSVAAQTEMPFEVIVVDNNSTDNTVKIAKSYPFVRVVKAREQGRVHARDAGFNAAKGDVIARVDADSRLASNWIGYVRLLFSHNQRVMAATGDAKFYDTPMPGMVNFYHRLVYYGAQTRIAGTPILWGANMAVRKKAWLQVRDLCAKTDYLDEDIDLALRLRAQHLPIFYDHNMIVQASLMRGDLSPGSVIKYMATWPRNYKGLPFRAFRIRLLTWSCLLTMLPISIAWTTLSRLGLVRLPAHH